MPSSYVQENPHPAVIQACEDRLLVFQTILDMPVDAVSKYNVLEDLIEEWSTTEMAKAIGAELPGGSLSQARLHKTVSQVRESFL